MAPSDLHHLVFMPLCNLFPLCVGYTHQLASILWQKLWNVSSRVHLQKDCGFHPVGKAGVTGQLWGGTEALSPTTCN